ncbi:hypothetical protein BKA69DRAFT_386144 [Paraphysoderma sedebokerense]|nr:hypothetical protein BKA69DRAFT_386144 [Paraphysoderma sedebokerense]
MIPAPTYPPPSSSLPYITPPRDQSSSSTSNLNADETLPDELLKVQSVLIDMVDSQMLKVHGKLIEKERQLAESEAGKKEILVKIGKAWSEVEKVDKALGNLQDKLSKSENKSLQLTSEKELAEKELDRIRKEQKQILTDLSTLRNQYTSIIQTNNQLGDVNAAYNVDLKIQKRIQNKLNKEMQFILAQKKNTEEELVSMTKKFDKVYKTFIVFSLVEVV